MILPTVDELNHEYDTGESTVEELSAAMGILYKSNLRDIAQPLKFIAAVLFGMHIMERRYKSTTVTTANTTTLQ